MNLTRKSGRRYAKKLPRPMFFRITVTFADGRVKDNIVCEFATAKEALHYARARFDAINDPPKSIDALRITRDAAAEIADDDGIDWRP